MTEMARFLIELLQTLWPLREVEPWEHGVRMWLNKPVAVVEAGVHWVVPYFGDVRVVSTVPSVITTPLCTITLSDGSTCTYRLSATICVTDAKAALCTVDEYQETTQELITSIPADAMSQGNAERLEHGSRGRLLAGLRMKLNTELNQYGVEVRALRFTDFALNLRTYRLLTDSTQPVAGDW